jgi:hypothetical protein
MAEGIQASFTGDVTRTFGIGFQVDVPSGKYPQRVSVFKIPQPAVGEKVTVSGVLTLSKDKDWVNKDGETKPGGYSLKVNDATVTSAAATSSAPAEDPWGTDPNAFDESTPF